MFLVQDFNYMKVFEGEYFLIQDLKKREEENLCLTRFKRKAPRSLGGLDLVGGPDGTRTRDLLRDRQAF